MLTQRRPAYASAVERHDAVGPLEQDWAELAERIGASPFLFPGWISGWWRAFGRGRLQIFAVRRRGRLAGILPLYARFGALRSTTNAHTPEFGVLAEDGEAAGLLAEAVFSRRPRSVSLGFVDPAASSLDECRLAAREAGYRDAVRVQLRSPYLSIDGDWTSYVHRLKRSVRYEAERRERRLREAGRLTLDIADGRDRLEPLLMEGFGVESSGWKGERATAIAAQTDTKTFYTAIARWAAHEGWLRLVFLRLDDRPLAFAYALEKGGFFYVLKSGYDEAHRSLGAGALLRYMLLRRAHVEGLSRYEFLGADEPWKLVWTSTRHERVLYQAFRSSPLGVVERLAETQVRPAMGRFRRRFLTRRGHGSTSSGSRQRQR